MWSPPFAGVSRLRLREWSMASDGWWAGPPARRTYSSDRLARRGALLLWPVVADIGVRIRLDPAIEDVREFCRLSAAAGEVLLQHDDQDEVSFVGEVGDVLGDDGASFGTCVPGDRSVVGRTQPNLRDMMRVSAVLVPKNAGGRGREHLIDNQTDHRVYANNAWRSWVARRLRSRAASLRSMSRSISLRCSAA
jgi:hypothetical protein